MGQKLADKVIHAKNKQQIEDLLTDQRNEIDDVFFNRLFEASKQYEQEHKYDAAINILRAVFMAGQITSNTYFMALSLFHVAYVEIAKRSFDKALKMIERCIIECDKATDIRCYELKGQACHLSGWLQHQEYGNRDEALRKLQESLKIYEKLQKPDDAKNIRVFIQEIQQQSPNANPPKPLNDVLDEIINSRRVLDSLQSDIEMGKTELENLITRRDSLQAEIQELSDQYRYLSQQNVETEHQLSNIAREVDSLQKRVAVLTIAQQVPLWAAAIRAEISDGEITDLTLPLLAKLQYRHDEHVRPLIAEIRARNSIQTNDTISLSGLSGEQRLFAGIADAIQLERTDKIEASEILLDTWETYLKTLDGNIQ